MTSIIQAAQTSVIQIIAGVDNTHSASPSLLNGRGHPSFTPDSNASDRDAAQGGFFAKGNGDGWSIDEEESSDEVEDLLRRQQVRIQELEQRLLDSADSINGSGGGGRSPTIKTITI